jgi:hypothetical protein
MDSQVLRGNFLVGQEISVFAIASSPTLGPDQLHGLWVSVSQSLKIKQTCCDANQSPQASAKVWNSPDTKAYMHCSAKYCYVYTTNKRKVLAVWTAEGRMTPLPHSVEEWNVLTLCSLKTIKSNVHENKVIEGNYNLHDQGWDSSKVIISVNNFVSNHNMLKFCDESYEPFIQYLWH